MTRPPVRRRGGLGLAMAVDLLRDAWWTRRWITLLVVVLVAVSLAIGTTAHYAVPWMVYGGL